DGVVVAHPEERAEDLVLRGGLPEASEGLELAARRGAFQPQRLAQADRGRDRGVRGGVEGLEAQRGEDLVDVGIAGADGTGGGGAGGAGGGGRPAVCCLSPSLLPGVGARAGVAVGGLVNEEEVGLIRGGSWAALAVSRRPRARGWWGRRRGRFGRWCSSGRSP